MTDRYSRQEKHVVLDKLREVPITIVGCGAAGRNVALALTQMGAGYLQLVDFDTVEEVNIPTQGWKQKDIGKFKVEALIDECKEINSITRYKPVLEAYSPRNTDITPVVFSCADSMKARKIVYNNFGHKCELLIDTRMAAEVARIVTLVPGGKDYYESTLFDDKDAYQDGCTSMSTFYCASILSGMAVSQLAKWTRDLPLSPDFTYNIFSNDFFIKD